MKRFNNIRRLLLSAATLAVVGTSMLPGCTSVDDTLGSNLVPDNQQMYAGYVTIPRIDELNPKQYVETRLYQTDSIISSNISYGYFGQQLNDTIGRRTAGFLSQMINYYSVPEGYFGETRSSTRRCCCSRSRNTEWTRSPRSTSPSTRS